MSFEKLFLHVCEHKRKFLRMRFLRRVQKWILVSNYIFYPFFAKFQEEIMNQKDPHFRGRAR